MSLSLTLILFQKAKGPPPRRQGRQESSPIKEKSAKRCLVDTTKYIDILGAPRIFECPSLVFCFSWRPWRLGGENFFEIGIA